MRRLFAILTVLAVLFVSGASTLGQTHATILTPVLADGQEGGCS